MDFFRIVHGVWGLGGVVWVTGWVMGVGVGRVNSFRPIYEGNPFIKILERKSFGNFFRAKFFLKKKKLRNFFIGKISDFFFKNFLKTCLNKSSKGTKNNQKKILSSFREIWEKLEKFFAKKGIFDFDEIFWKKEHSDFFLRIFQKTCLTII